MLTPWGAHPLLQLPFTVQTQPLLQSLGLELTFPPVAPSCAHKAHLHTGSSLRAYSVACTASAHRCDPC